MSEPSSTLAARLQKMLDSFGPGPLAELRRGSPQQQVHTATFWTLLLSQGLVPEAFQDGSPAPEPWQRQQELQWALIFQALALGLRHSDQVSLGQALSRANWSELRFIRLMRADADQLATQLPQLARYLKSKEQDADVNELIQLLRHQHPPRAEQLRQKIARDYYRTLHQNSAE